MLEFAPRSICLHRGARCSHSSSSRQSRFRQSRISHGSLSGCALGSVASCSVAYLTPYTIYDICQHFTNFIAPRLNQQDLQSCLYHFNCTYNRLQILHPVAATRFYLSKLLQSSDVAPLTCSSRIMLAVILTILEPIKVRTDLPIGLL
jgi:hypothetical protein